MFMFPAFHRYWKPSSCRQPTLRPNNDNNNNDNNDSNTHNYTTTTTTHNNNNTNNNSNRNNNNNNNKTAPLDARVQVGVVRVEEPDGREQTNTMKLINLT